MASQSNSGSDLGFEAELFKAADKLRGNLEPSEYKHVALGLIFLKYISEAFEHHRAKLMQETCNEVLAELGAVRATLVLYETAPRLADALTAIAEVLPGREVAVARELTKRFEECRTGSPADLLAHYAAHPPKGSTYRPDLEAAMWVDRAEVRAALSGEMGASFMAPPPLAIARYLLEDWAG